MREKGQIWGNSRRNLRNVCAKVRSQYSILCAARRGKEVDLKTIEVTGHQDPGELGPVADFYF